MVLQVCLVKEGLSAELLNLCSAERAILLDSLTLDVTMPGSPVFYRAKILLAHPFVVVVAVVGFFSNWLPLYYTMTNATPWTKVQWMLTGGENQKSRHCWIILFSLLPAPFIMPMLKLRNGLKHNFKSKDTLQRVWLLQPGPIINQTRDCICFAVTDLSQEAELSQAILPHDIWEANSFQRVSFSRPLLWDSSPNCRFNSLCVSYYLWGRHRTGNFLINGTHDPGQFICCQAKMSIFRIIF